MRSARFRQLIRSRCPWNRLFGDKIKNRACGQKNDLRAGMESVRPSLRGGPRRGPSMRRQPSEVQIALCRRTSRWRFSIFSFAALWRAFGRISRWGGRNLLETSGLALAIRRLTYYFLMIVTSAGWRKIPSLRPDLLIWLPNILFQSDRDFYAVASGRSRHTHRLRIPPSVSVKHTSEYLSLPAGPSTGFAPLAARRAIPSFSTARRPRRLGATGAVLRRSIPSRARR